MRARLSWMLRLSAQSPSFLRRKNDFYFIFKLYSKPNRTCVPLFSKKITALLWSRKTAERTRTCVPLVRALAVFFLDLKSALSADFLILVTRGSVSRAREFSSSHTNLVCSLSRTC